MNTAPRSAGTHAKARIGPALVALAILVYLLPTLIAPLTFPGVYEDEPWVYLPMMEFARGNGLSFGALGEGQSPSLIFGALTGPIFWISPLDANMTIRLVSALACVGVFVAAYFIALRLGARAAFLAPAVLLAAPLLYTALRYGRMEAIALALGGGAIAAALSHRFVLAGVLSAFAVCVHPILVWIGVPCLLAVASTHSWRNAIRYVGAGLVAMVPQTVWTLLAAPPLYKYMVTSSISSGRFAVIESILREPDRYTAFLATLAPNALVLLGLFVALAVAGVVVAQGWTRWIALSIALGPLVALAIFSLSKNPYYFMGALCTLAPIAALGASTLPRFGAIGLAVALIGYTTFTQAPEIWRVRDMPTVVDVNAELARTLPQGAVVFSPLREAGLIDIRPDLRFYSFHSLAPIDSWEAPACADIDRRIREIVAADRRATSRGDAPDEAYLVMFGMPWVNYISGIYGPAGERMACLWEGQNISSDTTQICHENHCDVLDVRRRPLS